MPSSSRADIEKLAAALHEKFLQGAEKARLKAAVSSQPADAWRIHPAIKRAYDELPEDAKASNRAAARRIPDHLALIDFVAVPLEASDDGSWKPTLAAAIERHIERLAQAEHLAWCAERLANGWTYGRTRDNELKRHPLLVEWSRLSPSDQDKDRTIVRSIPDLLEVAGHKAVPLTS